MQGPGTASRGRAVLPYTLDGGTYGGIVYGDTLALGTSLFNRRHRKVRGKHASQNIWTTGVSHRPLLDCLLVVRRLDHAIAVVSGELMWRASVHFAVLLGPLYEIVTEGV